MRNIDFAPPDKSNLLHLYEVEQKPMREIAKELEISVGSVFNYIHKYGITPRPEHQGMVGKKHSDKVLRIISETHKGKKLSDSTKKKMSDSKKLKGIGHRKKRIDGYIGLYFPNHPAANKDGYLMEHRYVMERHIGRALKDNEVVHHINSNRVDNRIENLKLMTITEHASFHMKERMMKKKGVLTYQ